jgi:hypothetical protein
LILREKAGRNSKVYFSGKSQNRAIFIRKSETPFKSEEVCRTKASHRSARRQSLNLTYPRNILQFFVQDGRMRDSLVPIILSVVGCYAQVRGSVRQWTESNQLIIQAIRMFK